MFESNVEICNTILPVRLSELALDARHGEALGKEGAHALAELAMLGREVDLER
jgi:hypothetical protein